MVKQDERRETDQLAVETALPQAETSMAVTEPFTPDQTSGLRSYPPTEKWDDWVEYDPQAWPEKV